MIYKTSDLIMAAGGTDNKKENVLIADMLLGMYNQSINMSMQDTIYLMREYIIRGTLSLSDYNLKF